MALVKVMNDLLAAEEKLNDVKQLELRNNLVAKAELFNFDSVSSKLKSVINNIGSVAKIFSAIQAQLLIQRTLHS